MGILIKVFFKQPNIIFHYVIASIISYPFRTLLTETNFSSPIFEDIQTFTNYNLYSIQLSFC